MEKRATPSGPKLRLWLKRIGFWGFIFFLVKGLAWLILGYYLMK
ncbi:alanyl-tRNA synthetase [Chitinophaga agri]|uniref:Alanyl-tRNA synthetase n=1 Tax=Chitinophaga agri TaxID=2703787 RepID=A0A6B9ZEQ4_9BACT|nr:alanyl-tRNA synthetase [Chitinophaga agri]QHS59023.1 alanyl-tRNA synthetase [Chitinophaga agri]